MVLHERTINKVATPYLMEAQQTVSQVLLACSICVVFVLIVDMQSIAPQAFLIILGYLVIGSFLGCRKAIQIKLETRKNAYNVDELTIHQVYERASGFKRAWESNILDFYPKRLAVGMYKIICSNKQGNKVVLHCTMSRKKYLLLLQLIQASDKKFLMVFEWMETYDENYLSITYGAYSHIIYRWNGKSEIEQELRRLF